jgi:ribosomal protein L20A (L18A)
VHRLNRSPVQLQGVRQHHREDMQRPETRRMRELMLSMTSGMSGKPDHR